MKEVWKDIKGFEGVYQISNLGRVKSLSKTWKCGHGNKQEIVKREYFKKANKHSVDGYWRIILVHDGYRKVKLLHRLVAEAFISNPYNKPEVNHKYGNKDDNRASQLEWATISENQKHAFANGLKHGRKGALNNKSKLVLDTQTGIFYDCLLDAFIAKDSFRSYSYLSGQLCGNKRNKSNLIYV